MKKLLTGIIVIWALAGQAWATLVGKYDLDPTLSPVIARELHDGQYLAGIAHPHLWCLQYVGQDTALYANGTCVMHAGVQTLWNAEKGNASYGPLFGFNIPGNVNPILQSIGEWAGLHQNSIDALSSALTVDFFAGYRPIHTADVIGSFTYGYSCTFSLKFGVTKMGSDTKPQVPTM